jgi:hypothetical protein
VPQDHTLSGQIFIVTNGRENVKLGLVNVLLLTEESAQRHIAQKRATAEQAIADLKPQLAQANRMVAGAQHAIDSAETKFNEASDAVSEAIRSDGDENAADNARYQSQKAWSAAGDRLGSSLQRRRELVARLGVFDSGTFYLEGLPSPVKVATTDADGEFSLTVPGEGGPYVLAAHTQRQVVDETEEYAWLIRVPPEALNGSKVLLSNDTMTTSSSPLSLLHTSR